MLDKEGYRPNVGIVLCNDDQRVLWARRIKHDGWQFPQGGVKEYESTDDAMYRELREEIGLKPHHVKIIGRTSDWLHYDLPRSCQRYGHSRFRGQKQLWFLLRLTGCDGDVCLDLSDCPEFDHWRWVTYWQPLKQVVNFKRDVYQAALRELESFL
ncbi:RNA pyrophosphohydrolase [bacterium BMS3Bbin11]|nr:RNA pyrophosphohydrolase [bacterium BMS3Bbin11]